MVADMWRNRKGGIYLEPGEIAVMADLARRSVPPGPPAHPNALMLAALAEALAKMTDGPGAVLAPAPASVVRQAAQAYVRQSSDAPVTLNGRAPSGSKSIRPA